MGSFSTWLFGFVSNFFASFIAREAAVFVRRITVITAILTFIAGLTSALFLTIQTLISSVAYSLSDSLLWEIMLMCWPPHVSVCLGIILSAHLLRWVYDTSSEVALIILKAWS